MFFRVLKKLLPRSILNLVDGEVDYSFFGSMLPIKIRGLVHLSRHLSFETSVSGCYYSSDTSRELGFQIPSKINMDKECVYALPQHVGALNSKSFNMQSTISHASQNMKCLYAFMPLALWRLFESLRSLVQVQGKLPGFWDFLVFRHTPIPGKGWETTTAR